MTSLYEYFFKLLSKVMYLWFWSHQSKCLATPLRKSFL